MCGTHGHAILCGDRLSTAGSAAMTWVEARLVGLNRSLSDQLPPSPTIRRAAGPPSRERSPSSPIPEVRGAMGGRCRLPELEPDDDQMICGDDDDTELPPPPHAAGPQFSRLDDQPAEDGNQPPRRHKVLHPLVQPCDIARPQPGIRSVTPDPVRPALEGIPIPIAPFPADVPIPMAPFPADD